MPKKKMMRKARKQFLYALKVFPANSQTVKEKRTLFCQRRREYIRPLEGKMNPDLNLAKAKYYLIYAQTIKAILAKNEN